MRTITITRYTEPEQLGYGGHIEGTADDGQSWILYLDPLGRPDSYWAWREPGGGVLGDGVGLLSPGIPLQSAEARAQVREPVPSDAEQAIVTPPAGPLSVG